MQKLQRFIFCLLILFLPTQFGRHFWFDWVSVAGVRVDYLSPTLYVTDVLIAVLLLLFLPDLKKKIKHPSRSMQYAVYSMLVLFVGVVLSKNPAVGWYGVLKFAEFLFVGFYAKWFIEKNGIKILVPFFAIGVFFESTLALLQYAQHGSIGSLFYFFGERTFTAQTPGIANASINGSLILRPYATFSHPNVLAGYLVIAMTMIVFNLRFAVSGLRKKFFAGALILGTAALFATLSRTAIIAWVFVLIFLFARRFFFHAVAENFHKAQARVLFFFASLAVGAAVVVLSFFPVLPRFFSLSLFDESVIQREVLSQAAWQMFVSHPVVGVGWNNFLVNLPSYVRPSIIFYLQPVHNIFLLVLSQAGIVGFSFFLWFLYKTVRELKEQNSKIKNKSQKTKVRPLLIHDSKFMLLIVVLFLGLFDHYFLTLQQGQLLLAFVFGYCWARKV